MELIDIKKILEGKDKERVAIRGWLHNKRSSGGILFFIIRDGTGIIQCTIEKNKFEKEFEELEKLPVESVLELKGIAKEDKRAPYGYEISVEEIKILHKSHEDFPISKKYHGPDFLLQNRHLYLRSRKMQLILTIRSRVIQLIREWFTSRGYKEFQSPIFTSSAVEGGATLFPVKYVDGSTVYLTQSWQLYAEAAIASLGKIFTIAPSFRAEKSRTRRHLTEYWHVEAEIPFCDIEGLMKEEEELISFLCQNVAKEFEKELKELGRDPKDLLKVKPPFPRITYKEAIEILQKSGVKVKYGDDLGADEEKILASKFDIPFFVMFYPKGIKAFYHKLHPEDKSVTLSVDLLAPEGIGEIIGSGQRCDSYEELIERIKEENLDPKSYEWYLDLRKYGSVVHSGFGLGLERFLMWILKLDHIRDAIAFPRLINRVYP